MSEHGIIPAYRYGTPLRAWNDHPERTAAIAAELAIKGTGSIDAVRRLIAAESLTEDDIIAFGRLNFRCFLSGFEPLVALVDVPVFDPDVALLLARHSKHFT
jgi:hypothetical protein